jgi:hypothetical protein
MSRAKKLVESFGELKSADAGARVILNEKLNVPIEQAKEIQQVLKKEGYNVTVSSSDDNVYFDGIWNIQGRYYGLVFDKGGFALGNVYGGAHCHNVPFSECVKMKKELDSMSGILEKIQKINPELV